MRQQNLLGNHSSISNEETMSLCNFVHISLKYSSLPHYGGRLTTTLESNLFHFPQMPLTFISYALNILEFCIISDYANMISILKPSSLKF